MGHKNNLTILTYEFYCPFYEAHFKLLVALTYYLSTNS